MSRYLIQKTTKHVMTPLLMLLPLWAGHVSAAAVEDSVKAIIDHNAPVLIATFKQFHQNPE